MSDWQLCIPYRSRSDPLTDVADAARELPTDEERAVVRQLVLDEIVGGSAATVGELLDKLEKAGPAGRRKMLDDARAGAGLPTTGDVEFDVRFKMLQHSARLKAGSETRPMRLAYSPSGAIIDLNERDDDAARARPGGVPRRQREDRHAERAVEAEAMRVHDEARAARTAGATRPHVPRRPMTDAERLAAARGGPRLRLRAARRTRPADRRGRGREVAGLRAPRTHRRLAPRTTPASA